MIKNARNYLCINAVCCYVKAHRRNRAAVKDSCTLCGSRLTFRLLLHVSRMFSILFMFSSEINISVTTNSKGSGVSGLDLSDATCNLSEGLSESSDALLDKWPAIFSAGVGKKKSTTADRQADYGWEYETVLWQLHIISILFLWNFTIILPREALECVECGPTIKGEACDDLRLLLECRPSLASMAESERRYRSYSEQVEE